MKVAYLAHPVGGKDIVDNLGKIQMICRQINIQEPEVVPFAPYYLDCCCLDDSNPNERARGIKNDTELFSRGFIDEVRLYGNRISGGMLAEIKQAQKLGIPVVPMTPETLNEFAILNFDGSSLKQYEYLKDCTYGNVERWLSEQQLEVLHLYRDHRQDWGDDGGYMICVIKRGDKFGVGIFEINYNVEIGLVLDESEVKQDDYGSYCDFVYFDSLIECQNFLDQFVQDLDACVNNDLEHEDEIDETLTFISRNDHQYISFLKSCIFSYSEYRCVDRPILNKLTWLQYTPNFLDNIY